MVKNLPANAGGGDSIPRLERSSEVQGNVISLQYLCLENLRNRGAWKATAHGSSESWMHKKKRVQFGGNASICRSRSPWSTGA